MSEVRVKRLQRADDRSLPVFRQAEELLEKIRARAFSLFADRGFKNGGSLDGWLLAEQELCWPAAKIVESEVDYTVELSLGGYDPGEVEITVTPGEIVVQAHAETERKPDRKKRKTDVHRSECRSNDVFRRFEFGVEVDSSRVSASLENDVLKIVAPKREAEARDVKIATAA